MSSSSSSAALPLSLQVMRALQRPPAAFLAGCVFTLLLVNLFSAPPEMHNSSSATGDGQASSHEPISAEEAQRRAQAALDPRNNPAGLDGSPPPVPGQPPVVVHGGRGNRAAGTPYTAPPPQGENGSGGPRAGGGTGPGADRVKQDKVRAMMKHAWDGYRAKSWGMDELHPVDGSSNNWMAMGLTIIDSLDTLWLMGMRDEFDEAREWVAKNLQFAVNRDISLFETNIRVLGGLLSAFDLSKDKMFLEKATDLADRFLPAFDPVTGIPKCSINLVTKKTGCPGWTGGQSILSEIGTLQLEFVYLSHHTGNPVYADAALRVFDVLDKMDKKDGLYSVYVAANGLTRDHVTIGALGDSFYEYLMKIWVMMGKGDNVHRYQRMYEEAVRAIRSQLIQKSSPNGLTYIAEKQNGRINPKMDHLVCFAGAMFAEGARQGIHEQAEERASFSQLGAEITATCREFYNRTQTGLSPELVRFQGNNDFVSGANHYLLRPETVESYFVLWRDTHDEKYRRWGWEYINAVEKHCKVQWGYSGVRDVNRVPVQHDNMMQSFFLAESLKYLYLLYSDDNLIPLDRYVFNTECHPLSVFSA